MTAVPIPEKNENHIKESALERSISDLMLLQTNSEGYVLPHSELDEVTQYRIADEAAEIIYGCIFSQRPLTLTQETQDEIKAFIVDNRLDTKFAEIYDAIGSSANRNLVHLQFLLTYSMHLSFPGRPEQITKRFFEILYAQNTIFISTEMPAIESHLPTISENRLEKFYRAIRDSHNTVSSLLHANMSSKDLFYEIAMEDTSNQTQDLEIAKKILSRITAFLWLKHVDMTGKPITPICEENELLEPEVKLTHLTKERFQEAFSLFADESINFGAEDEELPTGDRIIRYNEILTHMKSQISKGSLDHISRAYLMLTSFLLLNKKYETGIDKVIADNIFTNLIITIDSRYPGLSSSMNFVLGNLSNPEYLKKYYGLKETLLKYKQYFAQDRSERILIERFIYLFIGALGEMNGFNSLDLSINEKGRMMYNGDRILLALLNANPKQALKVIRELRTVKTTPLGLPPLPPQHN